MASTTFENVNASDVLWRTVLSPKQRSCYEGSPNEESRNWSRNGECYVTVDEERRITTKHGQAEGDTRDWDMWFRCRWRKRIVQWEILGWKLPIPLPPPPPPLLFPHLSVKKTHCTVGNSWMKITNTTTTTTTTTTVSATVQTDCRAHPAYCKMGIGFLPGG